MRPSVSAMYRWLDHFPQHDIAVEFARARRPGKKGKRVLVQQTPRWQESIRKYRGVYYLIGPCGAVFVVRKGEFIVDVFPMNEAERFTGCMQGGMNQYRAAMRDKQAIDAAASGAGEV